MEEQEKYWDVMQGNTPYKIKAKTQQEAVQKLMSAGITRPQQQEYLTNKDGSFRMSPDGGVIPDPRSTSQQIKTKELANTLTDPKKLVPAATELVGEGLGTVGGFALGNMVGGVGGGAGAVLGGAGGAGGGRYLGERLVGNTETAGKEAAEAAGWSAVGGTAFEVGRQVKNLFFGFRPPLRPSEIKLLKDYVNPDYEQVAKETGTTPRMDQLRDWNVIGPNKDPEQTQLTNKIGVALANPSAASEEARRVAGEYATLYAYLNPSPVNEVGYLHSMGVAFDAAIDQEYKRRVGAVEGELKAAQRQLQKASQGIPGQFEEELPIALQAEMRLTELAQTSANEVDAAWDAYRTGIGQGDKTTLESATFVPIPDWFKRYSNDIARMTTDKGLTPNQRAIFSRLQNSLFNTKGKREVTEELNPMRGAGSGPRSVRHVSYKSPDIDIAALDSAIVEQGHRVSSLRARPDPSTPLKRETELLEALKQWREEASSLLPKDVNDAYTAAQVRYARHQEEFRKGLVGSLLTKDGEGKYLLKSPAQLVRLFESKDIAGISQLQKLADSDPALKSELRKLAFAHYRANVMPDGVINLDKHKDYMGPISAGGYKEFTKGFFSEKDWAQIQKAGGYAATMHEKELGLKKVQEAWNLALGGKLRSLDDASPQKFVSMLFPTKGTGKVLEPQETKYLMHILKKHDPDSVPAYQQAVRQDLMDRIVDPKTGALDGARLQKILVGTSGLNIQEALGKDYTDRLKRVMSYIERMNDIRILPGPLAKELEVISGTVQAAQGPLSHGGMIRRIVKGWREHNTQRALYRALTDPDTLKSMERHYARVLFGAASANYAGAFYGLAQEDENTND